MAVCLLLFRLVALGDFDEAWNEIGEVFRSIRPCKFCIRLATDDSEMTGEPYLSLREREVPGFFEGVWSSRANYSSHQEGSSRLGDQSVPPSITFLRAAGGSESRFCCNPGIYQLRRLGEVPDGGQNIAIRPCGVPFASQRLDVSNQKRQAP